jgi:hypothetical protein
MKVHQKRLLEGKIKKAGSLSALHRFMPSPYTDVDGDLKLAER